MSFKKDARARGGALVRWTAVEWPHRNTTKNCHTFRSAQRVGPFGAAAARQARVGWRKANAASIKKTG